MQTDDPKIFGKAGRLATAIMCSLLLAACMSPMAARHSYQDGWRHVEFVGPAAAASSEVNIAIDCRQDPTPKAGGGSWDFILVKENQRMLVDDKEKKMHAQWVHHLRYWIAPAENAMALKAGDELYANANDCQMPVAPYLKP